MKLRKKSMLLMLCLAFAFLFACGGVKQAEAASKPSYTIYVNRKTNIVNVINNKTKKLTRSMYCSTGKKYGTIKGSYNTCARYKWRPLFGNVYGMYATRIYGSYLFHSVPYYKSSHSQVETKEYNKLGRQASMGCIRLAVVDAKWIYDNCKLGTKVVIGEKTELKKPNRPLVKISTKKNAGWDPTDPDKKNPYYPTLKLKKSSLKKVKQWSKFSAKDVIKVASDFTSTKTLLSKVKVSGTVNTKKVGKYKVTYTLTDPATLLKKTLKVTFEVTKAKKPAAPTTEKPKPTEPTTPTTEAQNPTTPTAPTTEAPTPTTPTTEASSTEAPSTETPAADATVARGDTVATPEAR